MTPLQVSPADYHRRLRCNRANVFHPDSWLSKSVLWELFEGSLFRWRYAPKQFKPTDQMRWGSLVDCLTTTPELVEETVAVSPFVDFRATVAQQWREEQERTGRLVISKDEFNEAKKAAKMLLETHRGSAEIFRRSSSQVVLGGKIAGLKVKGLVDLAPAGMPFLADLKTTSDFSNEGFEKTTARFGYHAQGGLYLALWNFCFPDDQREGFKLVWQDQSPPYEVTVKPIPRRELDAGFETIVFHLSLIHI